MGLEITAASFWYMCLCASIAGISGMMFGYDSGKCGLERKANLTKSRYNHRHNCPNVFLGLFQTIVTSYWHDCRVRISTGIIIGCFAESTLERYKLVQL